MIGRSQGTVAIARGIGCDRAALSLIEGAGEVADQLGHEHWVTEVGGSVLLLENDPSIRVLMVDILSDDGHGVRVCDSTKQVMAAAEVTPGALAVVDFQAARPASVRGRREHLGELARAVPTILVADRCCADARAAAQLGCVGFLGKPFQVVELSALVATGLAGLGAKCTDAPAHVHHLRASFSDAAEPSQRARRHRHQTHPISPRERDMAALVAEGCTNAEIGRRLGLAEGTVADHVEHALRKLTLRGRVRMAVWAVEEGLYQHAASPGYGRARDGLE